MRFAWGTHKNHEVRSLYVDIDTPEIGWFSGDDAKSGDPRSAEWRASLNATPGVREVIGRRGELNVTSRGAFPWNEVKHNVLHTLSNLTGIPMKDMREVEPFAESDMGLVSDGGNNEDKKPRASIPTGSRSNSA